LGSGRRPPGPDGRAAGLLAGTRAAAQVLAVEDTSLADVLQVLSDVQVLPEQPLTYSAKAGS